MFRRRAEPAEALPEPAEEAPRAKPEPFTYIQRGTLITGEIEAEGRVRVHGVVRGDVRVNGTLEVAEAGLVEGTLVEADEVKIIGRVVVERLVARGKVEIWRGGELIGDVLAGALDIEEGARFTGRSEMADGVPPAHAGLEGRSGPARPALPTSNVTGAPFEPEAQGAESTSEERLEAATRAPA